MNNFNQTLSTEPQHYMGFVLPTNDNNMLKYGNIVKWLPLWTPCSGTRRNQGKWNMGKKWTCAGIKHEKQSAANAPRASSAQTAPMKVWKTKQKQQRIHNITFYLTRSQWTIPQFYINFTSISEPPDFCSRDLKSQDPWKILMPAMVTAKDLKGLERRLILEKGIKQSAKKIFFA